MDELSREGDASEEMNMNLELGSGLDRPSFFEVAAQERVIPSLYAAFEHAVTVRSPAKPRDAFAGVNRDGGGA